MLLFLLLTIIVILISIIYLSVFLTYLFYCYDDDDEHVYFTYIHAYVDIHRSIAILFRCLRPAWTCSDSMPFLSCMSKLFQLGDMGL